MCTRVMRRSEVRAIDERAIREYGIPGMVLMENAGRGAAEILVELGIHGPVVICAGKGNNAGDGFVIARHLENRDYDVHVLLFCNPDDLAGDALTNYRIIETAELLQSLGVKAKGANKRGIGVLPPAARGLWKREIILLLNPGIGYFRPALPAKGQGQQKRRIQNF